MRGDEFGRHRVLSPAGALPQAAERLDAEMDGDGHVYDDEVELDAEILNIDSASFRQIEESVAGAADLDAAIAQVVLDTVRARGKQHNPVTGSGGMLLGRVRRIGAAVADVIGLGRGLAVGDRVATLVSLTTTPLRLERVVAVRRAQHQLEVVGRAVLFATGQLCKLPADLQEDMALAALDVAGAAPQVARLARAMGAQRVAVLGAGGKSGVLACAAARAAVGPALPGGGGGRVIAIEGGAAYAAELTALGLCDAVIVHDARDALGVRDRVLAAAGGEVDLMVSCVNVPDVEMSAVLATRNGGTVYFFSMATSFTKAALGAEGVSRDVTMIIGNGYCPGHAEETVALLRELPAVRSLFEQRYGRARG